MNNPLNLIDFYKADHRRQYPEGTTLVYSNLTPRKSRIAGVDHIVWFGLQYFIAEYLVRRWRTGFFDRPKGEVLLHYGRRMDAGLGAGAITLEHIAALHDFGRLPLNIRALPEGTLVPMGVPCMTMWNSHPDFFWLVNYLETVLSATVWGPCTSATTAHRYRVLLDQWCAKTGGDASFVPWQGHDFGMRGMFGIEAACMSGAGHLLSFTGTDTVPALDFLEEYYGADPAKEVVGGSVPATEHSVMCMGQEEGEFETFKRLITEVYPKGVVSIVSDTWDLWTVVTDYLPRLKDVIMARDGKVVIRPDSGDPVDILCGVGTERDGRYYKLTEYMDDLPENEWIKSGYVSLKGPQEYWIKQFKRTEEVEITEAEYKGVIELLWDVFGGTVYEKGYKQLDPHIGAIYGDSITPERCDAICARLAAKGFASTNLVFGIGSYTYTYVTRDTYGFAMKATYGEVNGQGRSIFKKPKTDNGTKNSAKGLLAVNWKDGKLVLEQQVTWPDSANDAMNAVMLDGRVVHRETLGEIRERLAEQRTQVR